MPFYEYQCQACGAQVEVMQKISDAPLKKCPECAKSKLVKLVSAPVFRLKGSGWYETDFKGEQDTKRNLVGEEKEAKVEAKADAPDAKPAAAPDTKGDAKDTAAADSKKGKPAEAAPAAAKAPARKPLAGRSRTVKPKTAVKRAKARPRR